MVQTGNGIRGCLADRSAVIPEKPRMSRRFDSVTFHKSMTIQPALLGTQKRHGEPFEGHQGREVANIPNDSAKNTQPDERRPMKDLAERQECNQTGWACKRREMLDEGKNLNHFKGDLWGRVPDM